MLFIIVIVVVVVLAAVTAVVLLRRSRSARSVWLGELSEIRRSSLGGEDEVTGALDAIDDHSSSADDRDEEPVDGGVGGEGEPVADSARDGEATDASVPSLLEVTGDPDRTISDAGTTFTEYDRGDGGVLRVQQAAVGGLRVFVTDSGGPTRCAVRLPRGTLWFHDPESVDQFTCTVRTSAVWVAANGTLFVLVEPRWTYVMCLAGSAAVHGSEVVGRVTLQAGQVGRFHPDSTDPEVALVGVDALESEGVIRRQRRLDRTEERAGKEERGNQR